MKSLISYIIKRNLYHIIFLICVMITGNETVRWWPWEGFVMGGPKSPFWFWMFNFVILQMWYFSSTNYNFFSLDFIIYCVMLIFIRFLMFALMFGGIKAADFDFVAMVELFLSLILTIIAMLVGTNPTFYSSSIHYPSFIILLICCLFWVVQSYN